jgi:LEA14-like dessication related protein
MRRNLIIILPLVLVLIFSSCGNVEDISLKGVDHVQLKGIENNDVKFTAEVIMYNPSSVNFRIREVNLKMIVDGNFIGTLTLDKPLRIKAKSDTSYLADFNLQLANIFTGASALYSLREKKQVTVDMQGFIRAKSWLVFRKIDVAEKRLVDVPTFSR